MVWSPQDLVRALIANPCFADALICVQPHWQSDPVPSGAAYGTVIVAYTDADQSILTTCPDLWHLHVWLSGQVCTLRGQAKPDPMQ